MGRDKKGERKDPAIPAIPAKMDTLQPKSRQFATLMLVALGYALLTVLFTRPLAWQAGDGYIANIAVNGDGSYHLTPYFLQKCLAEHTTCLRTDFQCFPIGSSIALNTNMPIPSLMAQVAGDTTTGLNWVLLLNCWLMGLGGYLFARLFIKSPTLAFVAGALFAFWMGRSAHLWYGHANLVLAGTLPFALYALHRAWPQALAPADFLRFRAGWAAIFGLLAIVTAMHDLILAGFLVVYGCLLGLMLIYRRLLGGRKWYWQVLVLVLMLVAGDRGATWMFDAGFNENLSYYYSGTLNNLFVPHPLSMLYQGIFFHGDLPIATRAGFDIGRVMFMGFGLMAVAGLALIVRLLQRKGVALPWMLVLAVLGLLYTMPLIRWEETQLLKGPFAMTHFIPGWNENRCPTRFMDVVALLFVVWVMANVEGLGFWNRLRRSLQVAVACLLVVALLAEHYPRRFPFVNLEQGPAVYDFLAKRPEQDALFVPFAIADGKSRFGIMWLEPYAFQPVHGRKMLNGYLSRIDDDTRRYFEQDTFMQRLVRTQYLRDDQARPDFQYFPEQYAIPDSAAVLQSLQRFQLHTVVLKPGHADAPEGKFLLQALRPFLVKDTTFAEGHRLLSLRW